MDERVSRISKFIVPGTIGLSFPRFIWHRSGPSPENTDITYCFSSTKNELKVFRQENFKLVYVCKINPNTMTSTICDKNTKYTKYTDNGYQFMIEHKNDRFDRQLHFISNKFSFDNNEFLKYQNELLKLESTIVVPNVLMILPGLSEFSLDELKNVYLSIFGALGKIILKYFNGGMEKEGEILVKLLSHWYFYCSNNEEEKLMFDLVSNMELSLDCTIFRFGTDPKKGISYDPLTKVFYAIDFQIITTSVTKTLKYTTKILGDVLDGKVKLEKQCSHFYESGIKSALYATYGYLEYTEKSYDGGLCQLPGHLILAYIEKKNDLLDIIIEIIFTTLLCQCVRLGLDHNRILGQLYKDFDL